MASNLKAFIFSETQFTDLHSHKFDIQIWSWHDHEDIHWHSSVGHTDLGKEHRIHIGSMYWPYLCGQDGWILIDLVLMSYQVYGAETDSNILLTNLVNKALIYKKKKKKLSVFLRDTAGNLEILLTWVFIKAKFRHRTSHEPNWMKMRKSPLFSLISIRFGSCEEQRLNWTSERQIWFILSARGAFHIINNLNVSRCSIAIYFYELHRILTSCIFFAVLTNCIFAVFRNTNNK